MSVFQRPPHSADMQKTASMPRPSAPGDVTPRPLVLVVDDEAPIVELVRGHTVLADDHVARSVSGGVGGRRAREPPVQVQRVDAILRTTLGKAPLIRAARSS